MAEKQLEFDFMRNDISKVTSLDYIGGQDEDLGGYCEPLIIQYSDGMEQYVLHSMAQSREVLRFECGNPIFGKIINNHKKAIFSSRLELLKAWSKVIEHLGIDKKLSWQKTNSVCDCDCTSEKFYETKRKDLRARVA
jgi:hypothetical protein